MISSTDRRAAPDRAAPGGTRGSGATRPSVLLLAVVALVCLLLGGLVGALAARSGGAEQAVDAPDPGSIEAVAAELAEGQRQDQAELATGLATAAEQAHDDLGAVLQEMTAAAPLDGGTGEPVDPEQAAGWSATLEEARTALDATGSGSDDQAVTRAALLGGVELLRVAVERAADGSPAEVVARDRSAAVALWQAGATRLDSLVIATGGEHIHLFLAEDGDPGSVPQEFQELHEDE